MATGKGQDMETGNDRQRFGRTSFLSVAMFSLAAALSACSTSTPEPNQMARSAAQTAPADLQLLCADAAAKATGAASSNVLPVTSHRIDATTYQVDLNVDGSRSTCIVDDTGNVVSMQSNPT